MKIVFDVLIGFDFKGTESPLIAPEDARKLVTQDNLYYKASASLPLKVDVNPIVKLDSKEPPFKLTNHSGIGSTPEEALKNCITSLWSIYNRSDIEVHVVFPSRASMI